ncbi:MAG: head-tail connector protein, partial [Rickettsiales bacterium]|nr:head-tail connector protein [Rickettsiales bacterium]
MYKKLLQLYKTALDTRAPWLNRWEQAQRYTMPTADDEIATLFDATADDAADNLAASMYSLLTPPESTWLTLVRESELSPDAEMATRVLRAHLNDSNFYTTIHQCYLDLVILGTSCLFMAENPIGSDSVFSFTAIPMTDIAILPNAVFHTTSMTVAEVME